MSYSSDETAKINAEYYRLVAEAFTRHQEEYIANQQYMDRRQQELNAIWDAENALKAEKEANKNNPCSIHYEAPPRKSWFARLFGGAQ